MSWPEADQDAALAWQAEQARKCPGCGTDSMDWLPDGDGWHAEVRTCPGCSMRERAQKAMDKDVPGQFVRLSRGSVHECDTCSKPL